MRQWCGVGWGVRTRVRWVHSPTTEPCSPACGVRAHVRCRGHLVSEKRHPTTGRWSPSGVKGAFWEEVSGPESVKRGSV